jgi:DNA-binding CsgD family transcriptional regulator
VLLCTYIFWMYLSEFPGGDIGHFRSFWRLFNLVGTSYYMLLPLPFLAATFFNKDEFERRRNRAVLLTFMAVMVVTYLTPLDWLQPTIGSGLKLDLLALIMFLQPLLPLRVERHYLELGLRLRPPPQAALDMQPLCDEFGISAREREILKMVVAGRSRRDIEASLFISGSTIKSHLYSSYKKLDVKNRVQLLNLLQHAQHRAGPKS